MENLRGKKSELVNGFGVWLNKKYYYVKKHEIVNGIKTPIIEKFKSGDSYCNLMLMALEDLGMSFNDFIKNSKSGLLKAFFNKLQSTPSFLRREERFQNDITSAFKAYMLYINTVCTK